MVVENVTGWNELVNGSIISASTVLYQSYFGDWYITILFLAFEIMLLLLTKSPVLVMVTAIFFVATQYEYLKQSVAVSIISLIVLVIATVLYKFAFKK